MPTDAFLNDLELLLKSRHTLIWLDTTELVRAERVLRRLADKMGLPLRTWTPSKGLRRDHEQHVAQETLSPVDALGQVEQMQGWAIYSFEGLAPYLTEPLVVAKLLDAARQFATIEGGIVMTGERPGELPAALRPHLSVLELPLPSLEQLETLARTLYSDLSRRSHVSFNLTKAELQHLARNLQGLTTLEAERLLTKAMLEDEQLGPEDIVRVLEGKRKVLEQDGLLEYYPVPLERLELVGADALLAWLEKRRAILLEPERARAFGLSFPKGVLLVGVQGSGKSLFAKVIAQRWGMPLIKLDLSRLYSKYIGETEQNLRRAIRLAERVAPAVLWLDEIEKALSGHSDLDGGVSQRVLGSFLAWLQERQGDVFIVATANDVSRLPPELVRKGRFDEIFFLDLPTPEARQAILSVHLRQRGRDPQAFDVERLADSGQGFSGAELEQVIVAALYTAFAERKPLSTELLLGEMQQTVPLSVTMREKLGALRQWAAGRAVRADGASPAADHTAA